MAISYSHIPFDFLRKSNQMPQKTNQEKEEKIKFSNYIFNYYFLFIIFLVGREVGDPNSDRPTVGEQLLFV